MSVLDDAGAYPPFVGVACLSVCGGVVAEGFVEWRTGEVEVEVEVDNVGPCAPLCRRLRGHEVLCADEEVLDVVVA